LHVVRHPGQTSILKLITRRTRWLTVHAVNGAVGLNTFKSVKSAADIRVLAFHNGLMNTPTKLSYDTNRAAQAGARTQGRAAKDPSQLLLWLQSLQGEPQDDLAQLDHWLIHLQAQAQAQAMPPDMVFELLELWRPVHLAKVDQLAKGLALQGFPLPLEHWRTYETITSSLQRAKDSFCRLHIELIEDSGLNTRMVIPGTVHSLRSVVPLARGLEYLSRAIRFQLANKVQVETHHWLNLVNIAQHLRASSFIDTELPGPALLLKHNTARAWFVYPLLLRQAVPNELPGDQFSLVDKHARSLASKVGFRIDDDGKLHDNPHGPTVVINSKTSVRLDSHRLFPRLEKLKVAARQSSVANTPQAASTDLLERLCERWCGQGLPRRWQPSEVGAIKLRFGLPLATNGGTSMDNPVPLKSGAASMAYVFGRFEHNTILRMAIGEQKPKVDPVDQYLQQGDGGHWQMQSADLAWVERYGAHGVGLGALIALRKMHGENNPLRIGRVKALEQLAPSRGESLRKQIIQAQLWPATAALVGLRLPDESFYHDCFALQADALFGPSLVVGVGYLRSHSSATLRTSADDIRIQLDEVIERGPGWQRIVYRPI
jgi:hypothetical protein